MELQRFILSIEFCRRLSYKVSWLKKHLSYLCVTTNRVIVLLNFREEGKSGQHRATHRLIAGSEFNTQGDSATENNLTPTLSTNGEGERCKGENVR